MNYEELEVR